MTGHSLINSGKLNEFMGLILGISAAATGDPSLGILSVLYNYQQQSLNSFITKYKENFPSIQIDFQNEEEKKRTLMLLLKVWEGIQNDLLEEKHKLFKDFLLCIRKNPPKDSTDFHLRVFFADCIQSLSLEHVEILQYLNEHRIHLGIPENSKDRYITCRGITDRWISCSNVSTKLQKDYIYVHTMLTSLCSLGLIRNLQGEEYVYEIVELGIEFLKHIVQS